MRVLVISAHPDDEALGCAGTILKHRDAGDELFWIVTTVAFEPRWSADLIQRKAEEVQRAADAYGMKQIFKLGYHTTELDHAPQGELIARIAEVVVSVKPDVVYTIHDHDVHSDHRALFSAVVSAIKPFNTRRTGVRRLLSFETLSSTDAAPSHWQTFFVPNVYSDISPYIDQKIACMEIFETEAQPDPQPRGASGIRALARYRGATIGVEHAEAFMLIRECI